MLDRLYKVSQTGVEVDNSFAVKNLRKLYNDAQKKDVKKLYLNYLNEVKNIKDPIAVRTYLQEIGAKVGPYMTTGTNPLEGKIASQVYKDLETSLNNLFAREQAPIKELYDQFSAMKRIEFDITKALSKQLREAGNVTAGNLVDDYGLSLIGSGLVYGSPMQVAKGGFLMALKGITKMAKDPNRAVQSAFKKVDDWYKLKGVESVIPDSTFMQKALPSPTEGAPKVQMPSGPTIPVAPAGSAIDITSKQGVGDFTPLPPQVEEAIQKLPPEQQEAAKQWYQQGLDLFGEKKNLEGGFSKLGAVAGVGGTSGIIALINVLFGNKDVKELESKEVSATETPIEKPNLREAFVNAENRGEIGRAHV
jgi:hypothetical protein